MLLIIFYSCFAGMSSRSDALRRSTFSKKRLLDFDVEAEEEIGQKLVGIFFSLGMKETAIT